MPAAEAETCRSDALRWREGRSTDPAIAWTIKCITHRERSAIRTMNKAEGTLPKAAALKKTEMQSRRREFHQCANVSCDRPSSGTAVALSYPGAPDS